MATSERYLRLADLASSQWGMVTAAQARRLDVTPQQLARMHRDGVLHRLQHGVYRLAGVPHDPLADLKAAWLSLDPEAAAADRLSPARPGRSRLTPLGRPGTPARRPRRRPQPVHRHRTQTDTGS